MSDTPPTYAELLSALRDARESAADWAAYASDYFQEKHDLKGDLAAIDAVIVAGAKHSPEPPPYRDTTEAVVQAARRFVDSLTRLSHWQEHSGQDAAELVAAVQLMDTPAEAGD